MDGKALVMGPLLIYRRLPKASAEGMSQHTQRIYLMQGQIGMHLSEQRSYPLKLREVYVVDQVSLNMDTRIR